MRKLLLCILLISQAAAAEYLVTDATVVEIGNTAGNADLFYVETSGGAGPCANQQIRFKLSNAGSPEIFNRAFSMALTAYASGAKVSIYDYHEIQSDCDHAEGFKLVK